jgi:hypothetical protein
MTNGFRYQDWRHPAAIHAFPVDELFTQLVEKIKSNDRLTELFSSEEVGWRDSELLYFTRTMGMPDHGPYTRPDRPNREWTERTAQLFVKLVREHRADLMNLLGPEIKVELMDVPTVSPTTAPPTSSVTSPPDDGGDGGTAIEEMPKRPQKKRRR